MSTIQNTARALEATVTRRPSAVPAIAVRPEVLAGGCGNVALLSVPSSARNALYFRDDASNITNGRRIQGASLVRSR